MKTPRKKFGSNKEKKGSSGRKRKEGRKEQKLQEEHSFCYTKLTPDWGLCSSYAVLLGGCAVDTTALTPVSWRLRAVCYPRDASKTQGGIRTALWLPWKSKACVFTEWK